MRHHEDETNFTVKGYKAPRGEKTGARLKIKDCYTLNNKLNLKCFFEHEANKKKFVPGPPRYEAAQHFQWTKRDIYLAGSRPKGKIGDKKKITFSEEVGQ